MLSPEFSAMIKRNILNRIVDSSLKMSAQCAAMIKSVQIYSISKWREKTLQKYHTATGTHKMHMHKMYIYNIMHSLVSPEEDRDLNNTKETNYKTKCFDKYVASEVHGCPYASGAM